MGGNTFQKNLDYYLKNRTQCVGNCMKPAPHPSEEVIFCSRLLIITNNNPGCYCKAYINPAAQWRNGDCSLADLYLQTVETVEQKKTRVGQQKQSRKKKSRR